MNESRSHELDKAAAALGAVFPSAEVISMLGNGPHRSCIGISFGPGRRNAVSCGTGPGGFDEAVSLLTSWGTQENRRAP